MKIIEPHRIKSREVATKDLERVREACIQMDTLMQSPIGCYSGGYALAHCQVTKKDPLCFFWDQELKLCILNPKIIKHTKTLINKEEGCLTFSDGRSRTMVMRYHKLEVKYQILEDFPKWTKESVSGTRAQIFQHEIDHFNGIYIYD